MVPMLPRISITPATVRLITTWLRVHNLIREPNMIYMNEEPSDTWDEEFCVGAIPDRTPAFARCVPIGNIVVSCGVLVSLIATSRVRSKRSCCVRAMYRVCERPTPVACSHRLCHPPPDASRSLLVTPSASFDPTFCFFWLCLTSFFPRYAYRCSEITKCLVQAIFRHFPRTRARMSPGRS